MKGECIWIPENDLMLHMKVIFISHCDIGGHPGKAATESIIRENFCWGSVQEDVSEFVRACIHCIITRAGEVVTRPLGSALHGKTPNEVVHIDFLYMGPGIGDLKYVLVVKDDLSGFVWLRAASTATGYFAADVLSQWVASFGSFMWLVSDQGSQFCHVLHSEMMKKFKSKKHFTTAYSPWSNGTVERVNREVLRSTKALLSEWQWTSPDWPALLDCVQSVLNHAPLQRLGTRKPGVHRTPLDVFTSIKPFRPLLCALPMST